MPSSIDNRCVNVVRHLKQSFRERFPDLLSEGEIEKTFRPRFDDPGQWCGEHAVAWICFEYGLPSWAYNSPVHDWCVDPGTVPEGYYVEFVNAAVAVVYPL